MNTKRSGRQRSAPETAKRVWSQKRRVIQLKVALLPAEGEHVKAVAVGYASVSQYIRAKLGLPPFERPAKTMPPAQSVASAEAAVAAPVRAVSEQLELFPTCSEPAAPAPLVARAPQLIQMNLRNLLVERQWDLNRKQEAHARRRAALAQATASAG